MTLVIWACVAEMVRKERRRNGRDSEARWNRSEWVSTRFLETDRLHNRHTQLSAPSRRLVVSADNYSQSRQPGLASSLRVCQLPPPGGPRLCACVGLVRPCAPPSGPARQAQVDSGVGKEGCTAGGFVQASWPSSSDQLLGQRHEMPARSDAPLFFQPTQQCLVAMPGRVHAKDQQPQRLASASEHADEQVTDRSKLGR